MSGSLAVANMCGVSNERQLESFLHSEPDGQDTAPEPSVSKAPPSRSFAEPAVKPESGNFKGCGPQRTGTKPVSIPNGKALTMIMRRQAIADPLATDRHNSTQPTSIGLLNAIGTDPSLADSLMRLR
ncbi:hypothetical protein V5F79_26495 [Xanthobacter flavus]|uniref:hypothetical protein n=1 Tax=Xanthobacter flavus TaxID=281 RepID=UPI003726E66F